MAEIEKAPLVQRWEMSITAAAEVIPGSPAERKLAAIKLLCRQQMRNPMGGDALVEEIFKVIEGDES